MSSIGSLQKKYAQHKPLRFTALLFFCYIISLLASKKYIILHNHD
jgi:hypothetical protein